MPRHSRNNTNSAAFTYAERQMAKAASGSQSGRLGRESLKNFDACSLCLERAREPRICAEGHLFCNECVLSSLLDQKKSIKKQTAMLERIRQEEKDELAEARASARERVLREFEDSQKALSAFSSKASSNANGSGSSNGDVSRGTKRKFELDQDELQKRTEAEEQAAYERNAMDQLEARRAKLPNFWLPSLTPTAAVDLIKANEVKLQTLCHASKPPHPLSLKTLTPVTLSEDDSGTTSSGDRTIICPTCRKTLSNTTKSFALKPCGHVLCSTCVDTLCRPDKACAKCNEPVAEKKGFVELKREGTGFAAGGQSEVKKFGLAFQG